MREITQKVYEFHELDKDIQEKLIEEERQYQKEAYCEDFLYSDMKDKAKQLLRKYFKDNAVFTDVEYSLNYCQGNGAMIEFELKYYGKLIHVKHDDYCHYYHERSFCLEYPNYDYLTDKQEEQLKEKIYNMNYELMRYGYEIIEREYSDDDIIEILNENEYYADGEIYQ